MGRDVLRADKAGTSKLRLLKGYGGTGEGVVLM